MTEHPSVGEKSQRGPQPSVKKPSQTSPTCTSVLYVITEMPAMERISLNGHCTYTRRARRVSLKSLKMTWWRDGKGKWKGEAIWQKKNWGQEITSSTSQRKPVSEVGVWDPGQCPDTGNTGCLQVSFSRKEVGSWDRLRKKVQLALSRNICTQETKKMRIFSPFNEGYNFKQKLKGKYLDRKEPKPYNWEVGSDQPLTQASLKSLLCDSYLWEKSSFLSQFLPT